MSSGEEKVRKSSTRRVLFSRVATKASLLNDHEQELLMTEGEEQHGLMMKNVIKVQRAYRVRKT
eukprot:2143698-Prymnesium_polylepis.1